MQKSSIAVDSAGTQNETVILSENIWDKYKISEQTIEAAELNYNANKTAYKGTVIEQEVGERSVLDVLIARQALLNSEINYFNKQKDREIVKTQIMYLAGILNLENLEVNYSAKRNSLFRPLISWTKIWI